MRDNEKAIVVRGLEIMRENGDRRVVLAGSGSRCFDAEVAYINNLDLADEAYEVGVESGQRSAWNGPAEPVRLALFEWASERNLGFSNAFA